MKKSLAGAACLLLFAAAAAASNDPTRVWSNPPPPSREALDRLNLEMAWAVYVPMDGKRDGFFSIQVDGAKLVVQTLSGLITVIDAENGGRPLWRARPTRPYQVGLRPAFNSRAVFTNDSGDIVALDRRNGAMQWRHPLRVTLSAPLSADDHKIYLSNVEARLIALHLPVASTPAAPAAAPSPGEAAPMSTANVGPTVVEDRPTVAWDFDTNQRVESKAILSQNAVFMAIPSGSYLGVPKTGDAALGNVEMFRYSGDSRFSAPAGHSDDAAYLGTEDCHVYAVGLETGKVLWRYFPGRPVSRQPIAVDVGEGKAVEEDLYVTAEGRGMARLDRKTGAPLWNIADHDNSPEADRLMAVNPKFVYAADGAGRMLVLDRKNGAPLSRLDARDFPFPIVNDQTDRIYLAANDGLIVCLHDKDYAEPLAYHRAATPAPGQEKTLAQRIQELKDKLAMPVSLPPVKMVTFKEWRDKMSADFGLKFFVSTRAFADAKPPLPSPDGRQINIFLKIDNKPLGDVLQDVMSQVDATYTQVEDAIVVGPAKPR